MRMVVRSWMIGTLVALLCTAVLAVEPADIREPEQIVFEGIEKVAVKDIQIALGIDFDAVLASHPDSPLPGYLHAIEATTLLGYAHSGFSAAQVAAEYDEQRKRIVVRVEEGRRHFCGEVHVAGAKEVNVKSLIDAVSQPPGRDSTPWIPGRPAPFDEKTMGRIREKLKEAFATEGFLSASFDVQIVAEESDETAKLEIKINDEGPRGEIGDISVRGNKRDSEAQILHYLDIRPGQRYDSGLAERLKARLVESGRYLSVKIDIAANTETRDRDREVVPIQIELREYEQAPPLCEEFTAEEQALLAFRDWIHRWSRGGTPHDIVLELSAGAAAVKEICDEMDMPMPSVEASCVKTVDVRIVVAPGRGQTVTLWLKNASDKPVYGQLAVFYPDRLLLGAPLRGTKLTLPQPRANQLTLTSTTGTTKKPDKEGRPFQWMLGVGCKLTTHRDGAPLKVKATLDTAATLWFLYQGDLTCELADGVWKLRRGGENPIACRIDAETGRPIDLEEKFLDEDDEQPRGRISLRTEIQAWEHDAALIEAQLATATVHDAVSPFRGLLEYSFDEAAFVMCLSGQPPAKVAAVESLRKLASRWSPPALADLWPPEFGEIFGNTDEEEDERRFSLPWELRNWTTSDFQKINSPSRRFLAATSLPVYRRLMPREGWLWPIGRDVILGSSSNAGPPTLSLINSIRSSDIGPLGSLVLASLNNPHVTAAAVAAGRERLNADGFRKGCEPLLAGDGWLSQWILSLTEAARSLDEAELRSIAQLLPDNALLQQGGASLLLMLKDEPQQPAAESLARVLNVLWNLGIRNLVAAQFDKIAPPSSAKPPVPWSKLTAEQIDQQLKSIGLRSAERKPYSPAEPKLPGINDASGADKLDALEKLAEELQKSKTQGNDKPAEKEPISIAEQIDRLQKQQKK